MTLETSKRLHIGIDVGGTNTDAVVVDGTDVLAATKTSTTEDVTSGIISSLRSLLSENRVDPEQISAVMVGTTHFTNAIVEMRRLVPTAVVRLCGAATRAVPPFTGWPTELRAAIESVVFMVSGGHEFDGRVIAELSEAELTEAAEAIRDAGISSAALTSVFSPVRDVQELEAVTILRKTLGPDFAFSISSEIGSIGLLERENATIMNASLRGVADQIVTGLEKAVRDLGLNTSLYVSQNDGTLMTTAYTNRYPIATFASGPTNSMRGAARLSGLVDCAVLDIGGTTSDVGMLVDGFPREAGVAVDIAGVRTNFRMPDVHSIGIGGGSLVKLNGEVSVGPHSVGFRITEEARVFGGPTLTATDLAVAAGMAEVGDPEFVRDLDGGMVREGLEVIRHRIGEALDRMKTSARPTPIVVVGGGSIIVTDDLPGATEVIRPAHHAVANAVGAAIAEVGGQVDRIVSLDDVSRDRALEEAKAEATSRAVAAGAKAGTVRVVDIEEVPLAYLPSNAVRIKVKAVGELERQHA